MPFDVFFVVCNWNMHPSNQNMIPFLYLLQARLLFTYKHFHIFLHLWSVWCAATRRSFCSLSKNDPICTIVCDKFPRLHKEKRRKKGTVRHTQIKAISLRLCCYVRFLSIELQIYKYWYNRVHRCTMILRYGSIWRLP